MLAAELLLAQVGTGCEILRQKERAGIAPCP